MPVTIPCCTWECIMKWIFKIVDGEGVGWIGLDVDNIQ